MRVEVTFYIDTADGREYYNPDTANLITRLKGGGSTIQTVADLLDGLHYVETGLFFFDTDGDYVVDTWYEDLVTWTYYGETFQIDRPFYYQEASSPTVVPVDGARIVQACILVVNRVNSKVHSQVFTAIRAWTIVRDIRDLAELTVTVFPTKRDLARASRKTTAEMYDISVSVQKRVASVGDSDDLMFLVEELIDHLTSLHRYNDLALMGLDNDPVLAPAHLRPHGVFTSIINLTLMEHVEE